jgi:TPR repeat protein
MAWAGLGAAYSTGKGVSADLAQGYFWLRLAVAAEVPQADELLGQLEPHLTDSQRGEAERLLEEWRRAHPAPAE